MGRSSRTPKPPSFANSSALSRMRKITSPTWSSSTSSSLPPTKALYSPPPETKRNRNQIPEDEHKNNGWDDESAKKRADILGHRFEIGKNKNFAVSVFKLFDECLSLAVLFY